MAPKYTALTDAGRPRHPVLARPAAPTSHRIEADLEMQRVEPHQRKRFNAAFDQLPSLRRKPLKDVRPPQNTRRILPTKPYRTNEVLLSRAARNAAIPLGVALFQIGALAFLTYLYNKAFPQDANSLRLLNDPVTTNTTATTYNATTSAPMTTFESMAMASPFGGFLPKAEQAQLFAFIYSLYVVADKSEKMIVGATKGSQLTRAGELVLNNRASQKLVRSWLEDEPEDIKKVVHRLDDLIEKRLAEFPMTKEVTAPPPGMPETCDAAELWEHFRNDVLLDRPFKRKEVTEWASPAGRVALRKRIEDALKDYPREYRIFCRQVLLTIAARSINGEDRDSIRKFVVDLRGIPGSGKDHLFRLINDLLGIPMRPIRIPADEQEGPAALLPRPWSAILSAKTAPSNDHGLMGLVLQKIFEARCTNGFLNFSEIDWTNKGVRNMMKVICDPAEQYLELEGLEVKIFIGDLNIGITSNDLESEEANVDRANKYGVFKKVTENQRETSATERFNATTKMFHSSIRPKVEKGQKLTVGQAAENQRLNSAVDAQQALVEELFEEAFPYLMEMAKGDPDATPPRKAASGRMLFVEDLTFYICDRVDAGAAPTARDIKNYIADFYMGRTPGETVQEKPVVPPRPANRRPGTDGLALRRGFNAEVEA